MKRFLFLILLGVAGAYVFRTYGYEGIYVASESMAPTLPVDTHLFVNKFILKFRPPARGEIVVFHVPTAAHKGMVKRVIAVAGDTIEIIKKKVYIDGKALDEPYVKFLHPDTIYQGDDIPPMKVPAGQVFLMGDNRDVSGDSRDWRSKAGEWTPFVPLELLDGVVSAP